MTPIAATMSKRAPSFSVSGEGRGGIFSPSPGMRTSPSPRVRGEGRGEGAYSDVQTRGKATSPGAPGRVDLSPQAGRGEGHELSTPALYRLMTWMSPAYPVGAFSYSGGIEWAVEAGDISCAETLCAWLATMIGHGSVFCDAAIFAHAHRAAAEATTRRSQPSPNSPRRSSAPRSASWKPPRRARPSCRSPARRGRRPALDRLTAAWDGPLAYPVAVAVACAGHGIALIPALHAFLHGVASNLVSAGVRLIPLGQTDGQRVLAALEAPIAQTAERALVTTIDDIGTATLRADIAGMRHETQYTRLFRS